MKNDKNKFAAAVPDKLAEVAGTSYLRRRSLDGSSIGYLGLLIMH
jgi:hypothetical protein